MIKKTRNISSWKTISFSRIKQTVQIGYWITPYASHWWFEHILRVLGLDLTLSLERYVGSNAFYHRIVKPFKHVWKICNPLTPNFLIVFWYTAHPPPKYIHGVHDFFYFVVVSSRSHSLISYRITSLVQEQPRRTWINVSNLFSRGWYCQQTKQTKACVYSMWYHVFSGGRVPC